MSFLRRSFKVAYSSVHSAFRYSLGESLNNISLNLCGTSLFNNEGYIHNPGFMGRVSASMGDNVTPHRALWLLSWWEKSKSIDGELRDSVYEKLLSECNHDRLDTSLLELNLENQGLFCNTFSPGPFMSVETDGYYELTSDMDGNFCTAQEFFLFKGSLECELLRFIDAGAFGEGVGMDELRSLDPEDLNSRMTEENIANVLRVVTSIVSIFVPGFGILGNIPEMLSLVRVFFDIPINLNNDSKRTPMRSLISEGTAGRIRNSKGIRVPTEGSCAVNENNEVVPDSGSTTELSQYLDRKRTKTLELAGRCLTFDICGTRVRLIIKSTAGVLRVKVTANNRNNPEVDKTIFRSLNTTSERIIRAIMYLTVCRTNKVMGLVEGLRPRAEERSRWVNVPRKLFNPSLNHLEPVNIAGVRPSFNAHMISLQDSMGRLFGSKNSKYISYRRLQNRPDIYFYGFVDQLSVFFPGKVDIALKVFEKVGLTDRSEINLCIGNKFRTPWKGKISAWKHKRFETDMNYLLLCCGVERFCRVQNKVPVSLYLMRLLEERGSCVNPITDGNVRTKMKSLTKFPKTFEEKRGKMPSVAPIDGKELHKRVEDSIVPIFGDVEDFQKEEFERTLLRKRMLNICLTYNNKFQATPTVLKNEVVNYERKLKVREISGMNKELINTLYNRVNDNNILEKAKLYYMSKNLECFFNSEKIKNIKNLCNVSIREVIRTVKGLIRCVSGYLVRFDLLAPTSPITTQFESHLCRRSVFKRSNKEGEYFSLDVDTSVLFKAESLLCDILDLSRRFYDSNEIRVRKIEVLKEPEATESVTPAPRLAELSIEETPVEILKEFFDDCTPMMEKSPVLGDKALAKKIKKESISRSKSKDAGKNVKESILNINNKYKIKNGMEFLEIMGKCLSKVHNCKKKVYFFEFVSQSHARFLEADNSGVFWVDKNDELNKKKRKEGPESDHVRAIDNSRSVGIEDIEGMERKMDELTSLFNSLL